MTNHEHTIQAAGGGYGPPPGGFGGPPPGGMPGGYGPPPGAPPGGMPMAPPGGGPMPGGAPGAGPGPDPELKKNLDTWFIISIANIFCCGVCWPLAAVAAFMAHTGKGLYGNGDTSGAQEKLKLAKILVIVNAVLAVLFGIAYGVLMATGTMASIM